MIDLWHGLYYFKSGILSVKKAMAEHKIYDLELVGVPRGENYRGRRKPFFLSGLFLFGLALGIIGGCGGAFWLAKQGFGLAQNQYAFAQPVSNRAENTAAEPIPKTFLEQLQRARQQKVALKNQLVAIEDREKALILQNNKLMQALSLADAAIKAAEYERAEWIGLQSDKPQQQIRNPYTQKTTAFANPQAERSPPPVSSERYLTNGFEETPTIDRIFIARTQNITLVDIAQRYGLSVRALKAANPGITIKRTRDGEFVREGTRINIPFRN